MKKSVIITLLFFAVSLFVFTLAQAQDQNSGDEQPTFSTTQTKKDDGYDENTIFVKFSKNLSKKARKRLIRQLNAKMKDKNDDGKDDRFSNLFGGRLALLEIKGDKGKNKAAKFMQQYKTKSGIEYIGYNNKLHILETPNDPSFSSLWAMNNSNDADIDAVEAWDTTTGSHDVIIGVIDTGLNYNHEDLAANVWVNPNEIDGNGIDDDGNGYVDDIHGINAITGTGDPMDDQGHGSHCSGTIGGVGNNGVGVTGVNWNVSIIGMKFLDSSGSGSTSDAIECINYALGLKAAGVNIRVLSNSWGGGGYDQVMADAISDLADEGILFAAAAGNDGTDNDSSPHYPSNYENANVISVASTTSSDDMSYFSNYGAAGVDLGAPGSSILSTTLGNSYSSYSGTSMAAPHVAGAAALLLSINDQLTVSEMKTILMDTGDSISALSGNTVSGKRLNLKNAVDAVQPPEPGINLVNTSGAGVINQGQTTTYAIDILSILGYSGNVSLSAVASPSLTGSISFSPNPCVVGSTFVMTVSADTSAAVGDYTITVTGISGSVSDTVTASLKVRPEGTTEVSYTDNTVVSIPDNDAAGITSTIDVPDSFTITAASAEVNITHTYIGDLLVTLTSPNGTAATLHDQTGGSTDNLNQTFSVADFNGEDTSGTWTLFISDNAGVDTGTLDSWTLTLTGAPSGPVLPIAEFSADSLAVNVGGSVNFTDLSGNTPTSWDWTFGGGSPAGSTAQNPTVVYNTPGTYDVSLTVTNASGSDTETKTGYITVTALQLPTADFVASNTAVVVGDTVAFTDQTIGDPTAWSWTFTGGTPASSTDRDPTVQYNTEGTYSVTLTATNGVGSDTVTKTGYITVTDTPLEYCTLAGDDQGDEWIGGVEIEDLSNTSGATPYSDFTSMTAHLTGGEMASVILTPTHSGIAFTEVWVIWIDYNHDGDFDDANEEVFTDSSSSEITGSFYVPRSAVGVTTRMRIAMRFNSAPSACGSFMYGEVEDYTVNIGTGTVYPPEADFSADATAVAIGDVVSFTDMSTNTPTSWSWSFPGGTPSSSTDRDPVVTYNTEGTYNVVLTVTNSAGTDTITRSNYITVTENPIVYCDVQGNDQSDEWIGSVEVGDLTNVTGPTPYSDFTSMSAHLTAGGSVSVTLTPVHSGTAYTEVWRIFIDYNHDGDFEDAGEEVFGDSSNAPVSGTFTVPASAAGVTTRMRVAMRFYNIPSPCGSYAYGEVEDYTVVIQ